MNQIGRKVYYEVSTGNVILDTGERCGDVVATTTEQDFAMYSALQAYVSAAVGVSQLEYGQDSSKFGVYNYCINKDTGAIVWGDLIKPTTSTQPTIEQRLATLEQQNLTLMDALATVYETVAAIPTTTV